MERLSFSGGIVTIAVCVPTLNARDTWPQFSAGLKQQVLRPDSILVIDSDSDDGTAELAEQDGFRVVGIARCDFHHGATRQYAVELSGDADVIVFLTQDAILASPDSLSLLLQAFEDPSVGAAYGRQLPRPGASAVEAHARLFNYPAVPAIRSFESSRSLGFKAAFFSNSFGAYRRSALAEVGGFPLDADFGEDTVATARLLLAGWKTAYVSAATAYHSHPYALIQEFRRYCAIGALHSRESWLLRNFGEPSGEGLKFVGSELKYLTRNDPVRIPSAIARTGLKFLGYRLGRLGAVQRSQT